MKRIVSASAIAIIAAGCSKTAVVDLKLVEPCDQKNQALNGVSSYVISSTDGDAQQNTVSFSKDAGPSPLAIPLGNIVITAQGFADDVSQAGASGSIPKAVGRTPPLAITEATGDLHSMVLMGLLDGFGKTTSEDGSCQTMTQDAPLKGRHGHTATFVPGLNKVLIWGGAVWNPDGTESFLGTAELYDPATGTFEELPLDPSQGGSPRAYHQATALPDGRVLITGGFGIVSGKHTTLASAVLFDPALGADEPYRSFSMVQGRANHVSTLMEGSGLVVISGGCTGTTEDDGCGPTQAGSGAHGASTNAPSTQAPLVAEVFDINQDSAAASLRAVAPENGPAVGRAFHTATSLENGAASVLVVAGGVDPAGPVDSIEIFRAQGGTLQRVVSQGTAGFPAGKVPARAATVAIDSTRLLIIGGQTAIGQAGKGDPSGPASPDVFLFSTAEGIDANALKMFGGAGRAGANATMFSDGSILIAGGVQTPGPDALPPPVVEILRPGVGTGILGADTLKGPSPEQALDHAAMAVLPNNQVFFCGGHTTVLPFTTTDAASIYFGK